MTPTSAGSRPNEEDFLKAFLEQLKDQRVPGPGDEALRGEVRNDMIGKIQRGVVQVWYGWP